MFQSFTGNSRRARQINLSGRNAGGSSAKTPGVAGIQNTIALAQQERLSRQRERDRLHAARRIQRVWRGHRSREETRDQCRRRWDELMAVKCGEDYALHGLPRPELVLNEDSRVWDAPTSEETTENRLMLGLRLLLQFIDVSVDNDLRRLELFTTQILKYNAANQYILSNENWRMPLLRLHRLSLMVLASEKLYPNLAHRLLDLCNALFWIFPDDLVETSREYYQVLSKLTHKPEAPNKSFLIQTDSLLASVLPPLQATKSRALEVYRNFAWGYLTTRDLPSRFGDLKPFARRINYDMLTTALAASVDQINVVNLSDHLDEDGLLWLLAYVINLHLLQDAGGNPDTAPEADYIEVVSELLSSLAGVIKSRISMDQEFSYQSDKRERIHHVRNSRTSEILPLPQFIRDMLHSLLDQSTVSNLLNHTETIAPNPMKNSAETVDKTKVEATTLATYALTLLSIFPSRGDEIRMWLYLGSINSTQRNSQDSKSKVPALKFFWKCMQATEVYQSISRDHRNAVDLIRPQPQLYPPHCQTLASEAVKRRRTDQEWRVIFIFLELYSFILKVIDDDEFLANPAATVRNAGQGSSFWARESALPLEDVEALIVFLKNVGFSMYWNASEIEETDGLGTVAKPGTSSTSAHGGHPGLVSVAGVRGMTVRYVRGTVTGLLRMLYERDSRRRFLPKDHWLMTTTFDMETFIPSVVMEEEKRHGLGENAFDDSEEEAEGSEETVDLGYSESDAIIGTRRAQQTRVMEAFRDQQAKEFRKRYLKTVTQRLEILENMPFLIPFATRVKIFREFVSLDQLRRRDGFIDPDIWRMSLLQSARGGRDGAHHIIDRHHAKIRRQHIFDDAFEQFYQLGDGLKEPIQITFVDKFGTVEAGIDGGGVTKEFITSVTQEAFSVSNGLNLFVENDQHLLYPNPAAVDEQKALLQDVGVTEGSTTWNDHMRHLLRQYEFLGRIIGKCLYEGILIDVEFAGFFLRKWALTGGIGSATRESGYRANLTDLRDLDESLYQGLLQLKNYPGNVEDFSLNFTITDNISTSPEDTRTITRELRPNGSNTPVTNENRLIYISLVARHRLQNQPRAQTNAFLHGLGEIIQPSWLSMFNQAELQRLISGDSSGIDVMDLRRHTVYSGVYVIGDDNEEHPSVKRFWDVMTSFSDSERRKVLKFVTSTPRAPLLGFGQLNPLFSIRDSGDDEERLPSASTCMNLLKMPRYSSTAKLREKLSYAINFGAGFDLS